jgi:hypothetical protein
MSNTLSLSSKPKLITKIIEFRGIPYRVKYYLDLENSDCTILTIHFKGQNLIEMFDSIPEISTIFVNYILEVHLNKETAKKQTS